MSTTGGPTSGGESLPGSGFRDGMMPVGEQMGLLRAMFALDAAARSARGGVPVDEVLDDVSASMLGWLRNEVWAREEMWEGAEGLVVALLDAVRSEGPAEWFTLLRDHVRMAFAEGTLRCGPEVTPGG